MVEVILVSLLYNEKTSSMEARPRSHCVSMTYRKVYYLVIDESV